MFAKLVTVFAIFAASAQVAIAMPPACLIAAVNTQSNPADLKAVCGNGAQKVIKYISSNCGGNTDTANSAFAAICKDAGVTVSSSSSSTSASASATGSSTQSANGTHLPTGTLSGSHIPVGTADASSGFLTQTANGTYAAPTASATGSGSGSGSGTGSGTGSGSGSHTGSSSGASPTSSSVTTSTGGAARLGMDLVGLMALGIFGAMLAQ